MRERILLSDVSTIQVFTNQTMCNNINFISLIGTLYCINNVPSTIQLLAYLIYRKQHTEKFCQLKQPNIPNRKIRSIRHNYIG